MLVLLLVCNIMRTYGFVLPETYYLLLKDGADYKVDMVINEDDYEMIDKKEVKELNIDEVQAIELNKLASIHYNNQTNNLIATRVNLYKSQMEMYTLPIIAVTAINKVKRMDIGHLTTHVNRKREIQKEKNMAYEYNYEVLLHEYYEQTNNEEVSDSVTELKDYGVIKSFKRIFLPQKENNNCNSIGLQAIHCLLADYKYQRRPIKEVLCRLWSIVRIWLLVYLAVAVPLWCTRGWCCCCLFCKFFKPRQTIDEAKKYLISNPPGVLITKTGVICYDPTEREKETYEEFEHFIKTL